MLKQLNQQVPPYIAEMKRIKTDRNASEKSIEGKLRKLVSEEWSLARSGKYQELQERLQGVVQLNDRAETLLNQLINAKKNLDQFLSKCKLIDQRIHEMLSDPNMLITQFFRMGGHGNVQPQYAAVFAPCNNEMTKCLNGIKEYTCLMRAVETAERNTYLVVRDYENFKSRYEIMKILSDATYTYEYVLNHYENGITALNSNVQSLQSVIKQLAAL